MSAGKPKKLQYISMVEYALRSKRLSLKDLYTELLACHSHLVSVRITEENSIYCNQVFKWKVTLLKKSNSERQPAAYKSGNEF